MFRLCFNLLILLILPVALARCPAKSIQGLSQDECYIRSDTPVYWTDAEKQCASNGGHLISIGSDTANTFLTSLISDNTGAEYWIGAQKKANSGKWVWSDGKRWSYTNWQKGEPRNISGDACITLSASYSKWYANPCSNIQPYLCKVPPVGGSVTAQPPLPPSLPTVAPCPGGWFTLRTSPLCYQEVQNYKTWQEASSVCNQMNGQLVSITSAALSRDLLAYLTFDGFEVNGYWTGLHANGVGTYSWTDGSPLNFTNWEQSKPSQGDAVVYMDMEANGRWKSVKMSEDYNFYYVCESAPNGI
jgi:C-type mannose receptor